jgi:hypothetical protein
MLGFTEDLMKFFTNTRLRELVYFLVLLYYALGMD